MKNQQTNELQNRQKINRAQKSWKNKSKSWKKINKNKSSKNRNTMKYKY